MHSQDIIIHPRSVRYVDIEGVRPHFPWLAAACGRWFYWHRRRVSLQVAVDVKVCGGGAAGCGQGQVVVEGQQPWK